MKSALAAFFVTSLFITGNAFSETQVKFGKLINYYALISADQCVGDGIYSELQSISEDEDTVYLRIKSKVGLCIEGELNEAELSKPIKVEAYKNNNHFLESAMKGIYVESHIDGIIDFTVSKKRAFKHKNSAIIEFTQQYRNTSPVFQFVLRK